MLVGAEKPGNTGNPLMRKLVGVSKTGSLTMSEISPRTLRAAMNAARRAGIALGPLTEGLPSLQTGRLGKVRRVPWEEFAVFTDRLYAALGEKEGLERWALAYLDHRKDYHAFAAAAL